MSVDPVGSGSGLFASLRGLLATSIELLRTRGELLATELEEEKLRLLSLLAYGFAAFFFLGFGLVFLAIFLIVLLWDTSRLLVIGSFTGLFLCGGIAALLLAMRQIRSGSRLFAASLAELAQDRAVLQGQSQSRESL